MNNYIIKLISNNCLSLIKLDEVKSFLRIDANHDDDFLINLINAGISKAEKFTCRKLLSKTWQISFEDFKNNFVIVPYNISQINNIMIDGLSQDIEFKISDFNKLNFKNMLEASSLIIEFNDKCILSDFELSELKIGILAYIDQVFHFRSQANILPAISKECFLNLRNYRIV